MLKCSLCGTEDQSRFAEFRKNKSRKNKDIYFDWCKDCVKQKDIDRRNKNKLNNNLTMIVKCPKCGCKGDYSSGFFQKSRYLLSKKTCMCKKCKRNTPQNKIRRNQAGRIRELIRDYRNFKTKYKSTMKLIGCSPKQLLEHLESKFKEGMCWENYGTYWHIDHIKPVSSFDLSDYEQVKQCFHYTNLQPLTAKENLEKGNKII